jgi:hypothetical protein
MSVGGTNPASLKGKLMSLEVKEFILGNDQVSVRRNELPQERSCRS